MDELLDEPTRDIVDVPSSVLGSHLRVEDDLQEEIAELVADRVGVTTVDRLEELVRLLKEVARQGLVALLTVPRTPAGPAQPGHHLHEIEEPSALFRRRHRTVGHVPDRIGRVGGHGDGEPAFPSGTVGALGSVLRAGCTEKVSAENRPYRGFTSTPSSVARSSSHPRNS